MRISDDGGSTWKSGGSDYAWGNKKYDIGGGSVDTSTSSSDSEMHICGDTGSNGIGNDTGQSGSGTLIIPNPSNSSLRKLIRNKSSWEGSRIVTGKQKN